MYRRFVAWVICVRVTVTATLIVIIAATYGQNTPSSFGHRYSIAYLFHYFVFYIFVGQAMTPNVEDDTITCVSAFHYHNCSPFLTSTLYPNSLGILLRYAEYPFFARSCHALVIFCTPCTSHIIQASSPFPRICQSPQGIPQQPHGIRKSSSLGLAGVFFLVTLGGGGGPIEHASASRHAMHIGTQKNCVVIPS